MSKSNLLLDCDDYESITGTSFYDAFIKPSLERSRVKKEIDAKKKPIPEKLRWAVWERDNFTCQRCGARKNLTVDHIYPESLGGEATEENCQTLCRSCNSSKGARI